MPTQNLDELKSGKRPQVRVTLNRYQFSSTVGSMNGVAMISFSKAHRESSGLKGGEIVAVTLELDTSPRDTPLPEDAQKAVEDNNLTQVWESQSPSHKKEYVRWILESKKPETRDSRIKKMCEMLSAR